MGLVHCRVCGHIPYWECGCEKIQKASGPAWEKWIKEQIEAIKRHLMNNGRTS